MDYNVSELVFDYLDEENVIKLIKSKVVHCELCLDKIIGLYDKLDYKVKRYTIMRNNNYQSQKCNFCKQNAHGDFNIMYRCHNFHYLCEMCKINGFYLIDLCNNCQNIVNNNDFHSWFECEIFKSYCSICVMNDCNNCSKKLDELDILKN